MSAAETLRALRRACGLGQEQWAAFVGVGRKTVQRWEAGTALPDARAEAAILELCAGRRVSDQFELPRVLAQARLKYLEPSRPRPAAGGEPLGRTADVDEVTAALDVSRLVTLTGPAGVGKTTLAFAVAESIARDHGFAKVLLAAVPDAAMVLSATASSLSLRQTKNRSLRDTVVAGLRRTPLLVLDNCEHLADIGDIVDDLLRSCSALRIVATSRRPLRRLGEHAYQVQPLAPDASIALFERAARATVPDFALDERNLASVSALCERLDHLPLAIELMGPRVRTASPDVLLGQIDRQLELLRTRTTVPDERHASLEAAVAWSYDMLSDREQCLYRSLGVFAGAFSVEAAAAVSAADPIATMDGIEILLDNHLIRRADNEPRFALLQTLRAFAREHMVRAGETAQLARAHATYHAARAAADSSLLRGPDQLHALRRLSDSYDDLRAALVWLSTNDAPSAVGLAVTLAPYWDATSALTEARSWLDPGVHTRDASWSARASAATWAGYFAALQGDLDATDRFASAGLDIWDRHDVDAGRGYALLMMGFAAVERGDLRRGERLLTESAAALERGGDDWGMARPLNNLGELARMSGDLDRAEHLHARALAIVRDCGDLSSQPNILCGLGHVHLARKETSFARPLAREALEISESLGNRLGTASALELLALTYVGDDDRRGARLLGAASALRERLGTPVEARDRALVDGARHRLEHRDEWRAGASASIDDIAHEARLT